MGERVPLVNVEQAMAPSIADTRKIDPAACRESVDTRFCPRTVAAGCVEIYARATSGPTASVVAAL